MSTHAWHQNPMPWTRKAQNVLLGGNNLQNMMALTGPLASGAAAETPTATGAGSSSDPGPSTAAAGSGHGKGAGKGFVMPAFSKPDKETKVKRTKKLHHTCIHRLRMMHACSLQDVCACV